MTGIGGIGMSGIAEVLLNLGYTVFGSDMNEGPSIQRLRKLGATVHIGHAKEHLQHVSVLVRSSAIDDNNPEIIAAKEKGIPIIPRAEMLAELMRLRSGIAIAGTHGKTTTTSLTATIFNEAKRDPTVIIGGKLNAYGTNAHLGQGKYLIAEADESDGSFLCLSPIITVVTNVDLDHVDHYNSLDTIDNAFIDFMNSVPFYGVNIVCGDDPGIKRLLPFIKRPVITYGFDPSNNIYATNIKSHKTNEFTVFVNDQKLGDFTLNQPGTHNILNALAAIGVALEAHITPEQCIKGLKAFTGVSRRFEYRGTKNGVDIIDDYAHHPVEIEATIKTAQLAYPNKRLIAVFQPHRFSRTKALFGDFCSAFKGLDQLLLTEIYPASEKPIPGVNSQNLAQGIQQISEIPVKTFQNTEEILNHLQTTLKNGDILLTLGAGNITQLPAQFLEKE